MTAFVNGVAVAPAPEESLELAAARELLRQQAIAAGLLAADEADEEAIGEAIEALLAREVTIPEPTEEELSRYYESHPAEFTSGDLVYARHILFQVTPGVNVPLIRARAEETLNTLLREPDRFEELARELSNCPSGEHGGNLGQIGRGETVPEFEKTLFKPGARGVQRDLVKSRYGFHILSIDKFVPGEKLPFEVARERVAERLVETVEERALSQYVRVLAGTAEIEGVDLGATPNPLVQ